MTLKNRTILFGFVLFILMGGSPAALGQPPIQPINENILKSIDLLYDNQFEQATELIQKEINASPQEPIGYFYLAMVSWSRLVYGYWGPKDVAEFNQRIDKTVAVAKKKIANNTADSWTYFYMGGALGFKARLRLSEEKYYSSFQQASEAITALKTASAMDPDNKSVLLGLGMFDYYSAKLSGFLKFLTYLLVHRGNSAEGLRKLHQAAEESVYSATEARSVLLYIYLFMENDPAKALPLARDLSARYPLSRRYQYLQGWAYVQLNQEEEFNVILKEFLSKSKEPSDDNQALYLKNQALYLEASRLMMRGYPELARKKLAEIMQTPDAENEPAMLAWPVIKMGMSYDLEQNREKALFYYKKVLAMENGAGAAFFAKKYIQTPIKKGDPFIGY